MSRYLHKSWQSERPMGRLSRRYRWYQGERIEEVLDNGDVVTRPDIRIELLDGDGLCNYFFDNAAKAQHFCSLFRNKQIGAFVPSDVVARIASDAPPDIEPA